MVLRVKTVRQKSLAVTAVQLTSKFLLSTSRIEDSCLLATEITKLKSILLRSFDGKRIPFLAVADTIGDDVLSDDPFDTWGLARVRKQ